MAESENLDYSNFIGFIGLLCQVALWLSLDSSDSEILKRLSEILILVLFVFLFIRDSKFSIPSVILIGAMIRMSYHSYTSFETLYGGDAPMDLFLANAFTTSGEISFVSHELYDNRLGYYSAWPLSQLIVAATSILGGISVLTSSHVIRILLYCSSCAVSYCIIFWFSEKGIIHRTHAKWGLIVIVFMPELVYWQMEVVRQNLGILAHTIFIFTLLKLSERENKLFYSTIMILSCCLLAFSHNLTSAISVLLVLIFFVLLQSAEWYLGKNSEHFKTSISNSFIILSVLTMLWWALVGEILFPKIRGVVKHFYAILTGSREYILDPTSAIPAELSPNWIFLILPLRDLVIMGFTAIGFLALSKKEISLNPQKMPRSIFVIYASMVISYFSVFVAFFFWTEPFRVLTLVAPLMAVSFVHAIEMLTEKGKNNRLLSPQFFKSGVISAVLIASLLAPFSHAYAPLYLYDDNMENVDYGEPSRNSEFAVKHLLKHSAPSINTSVDFPDSAIQHVGMEELSRFTGITGEISYLEGDDAANPVFAHENPITLLIRNASIYNPSRSVAHDSGSDFYEFANLYRSSIYQTLNDSSSKVYDGGEGTSIWYSQANLS